MFRKIGKAYPGYKCIGSRNVDPGSDHQYVWKTYSEVMEILESLARGLEFLKFLSNVDDGGKVYRIIANLGWLAFEETYLLSMAVWHVKGAMMCDSEELKYISEIHTGVTSKADLEVVLKKKENGLLPGITTIIITDSYPKEYNEKAEKLGIKLIPYNDVLKVGREHPEIPLPGPQENDLIGIYTTSGTTGNDKVIKCSSIKSYIECLAYK